MSKRNKPFKNEECEMDNLSYDDDDGVKKHPKIFQEDSDFSNIMLLMLLYILQGIPLGLSGSIPMILQQRNVSYKDQATFSLAFWPFSVKLLWAPIVDSCYWQWMGRRKSWLVPSQYLIGIFMLILSMTIKYLLDQQNGSSIFILTSVFFALTFLAATQDIAVDGWALTMLSSKNLGWASTCNSVGQTTGYFFGYVVFLALESKDFCVNYLGQNDSLVTLPGFFFFWGLIFILTTSLVWLFKKEKNEASTRGETELDLVDTYKVVVRMLKMTPIQQMVLVLLTVKIGFAAADSLTVLKLTEAGVPKETLALLSIPLTPLQILLPLYISKFTAGPRPMDIYLRAYLPRLSFGIVFAALIWITPSFKGMDGHFGYSFYAIVVCIYMVHQVMANCMFVSQMAFYSKVSDPSVGGTYMTLLNTFTNLGGNWPTWAALRFVSELTWKACHGGQVMSQATCNTLQEKMACENGGGVCAITTDGYYVESIAFVVVGLLWYGWGSRVVMKLQSLPKDAWLIKTR